jgi:hypothetical protein
MANLDYVLIAITLIAGILSIEVWFTADFASMCGIAVRSDVPFYIVFRHLTTMSWTSKLLPHLGS